MLSDALRDGGCTEAALAPSFQIWDRYINRLIIQKCSGWEAGWASELSRPALMSTQSPVQWVPEILSAVKRGRGVTLTTHPYLVLRSRMCRSYTPLPLDAFMVVVGQLYLLVTVKATRQTTEIMWQVQKVLIMYRNLSFVFLFSFSFSCYFPPAFFRGCVRNEVTEMCQMFFYALLFVFLYLITIEPLSGFSWVLLKTSLT
jgi:hypothetical protein